MKGKGYDEINSFAGLSHIARYGMLAFLIHRYGWRRGAELGVAAGTTSDYLLETFPFLHLTGVDSFVSGNRSKAQEVYARHAPRATLLVMPTHEASKAIPDESLDFAFIDADHSYEAVRLDIENWMPKVKPHGMLLGHDYVERYDGVIRAVNEAFGGQHHIWPKTIWGVRPSDVQAGYSRQEKVSGA